MPYNIRFVSTYPPRKCGIGTFTRDFVTALGRFTGEVVSIAVSAIDKDKEQYFSPVTLCFVHSSFSPCKTSRINMG